MPKFTYLLSTGAVWLFRERGNASPILQMKKLRQGEDTLSASSEQSRPHNSGFLTHWPCCTLSL